MARHLSARVSPVYDRRVQVFCLSIHADYSCRHAGACCRSDWPIPIDRERLSALRSAIAGGHLPGEGCEAPSDPDPFVDPGTWSPDVGTWLRVDGSGACAFYERRTGLCAIHQHLGPELLPLSCQHFPRVAVIERDAAHLTLSHYCPTVARLTFRTDVRPAIVPAPRSLVEHIHLEGLDATNALPPLLRPGLLTDLEGYRAWVSFVVTTLAEAVDPITALERVAALTERLCEWSPRSGPLAKRVIELAGERLPSRRWVAAGRDGGAGVDPIPSPAVVPPALAYELVRRAVPPGLHSAALPPNLEALDRALVAPVWPAFARPVCNYLTARAFASWCPYQSQGLLTTVRVLGVSLSVARAEAARQCGRANRSLDAPLLTEAFRAANLLLVHHVDPAALAGIVDGVEIQKGRARRRSGAATTPARP